MIMARLSLLEQETIFVMNEKEKTATIFTYNRAYQKKLQELCRYYPDEMIMAMVLLLTHSLKSG